jgi:hypothetical protein
MPDPAWQELSNAATASYGRSAACHRRPTNFPSSHDSQTRKPKLRTAKWDHPHCRY